MNKSKAIEKLSRQKQIAKDIISLGHNHQEFKKWHRDTEIAIERIFEKETRHSKDFTQIDYSPIFLTSSTTDSDWKRAYQQGVQTAITVLSSFIESIWYLFL